MTAANFQTCFTITEQYEGWHQFSNDPHDAGGATYSGVTQRAYNAYRLSLKQSIQDVRRATDDEVRAIGKLQYWDPVRGDELFVGLDLVLFDISFNSGPVTAIKFLQQALRVAVDGQFGLETLGALNRVPAFSDGGGARNRADLVNTICARRMSFWHSLSNFWRFGKGWTARGVGIEDKADSMMRAAA